MKTVNTKKSVKGKYFVAVTYNKTADMNISITIGKTEAEIIYKLVMSGVGSVIPYRDMEVKIIGMVDEKTTNFTPIKTRIIPWDTYSLPLTEKENLETLGEEVVKALEEKIEKAGEETEEKDKTNEEIKTESDPYIEE